MCVCVLRSSDNGEQLVDQLWGGKATLTHTPKTENTLRKAKKKTEEVKEDGEWLIKVLEKGPRRTGRTGRTRSRRGGKQ